jgi:hypothetical protein
VIAVTEDRAERIRVIAEDVGHSHVLSRDDESMVIEVPADMAPGLMVLWGMGNFVPIHWPGLPACPAPRRQHGIPDRGVRRFGDDLVVLFVPDRARAAPGRTARAVAGRHYADAT